MKKIFTNSAFSLMELIIALVLVTFVFLGIISINMALTNNNQDIGQRYLVKSQTQATLNHILNNASLAVGDGSTTHGMADQGVLTGATLGDPNSFCIHQAGTSTPSGQNIISSATDIWLCYTWVPATHQINYCTMGYSNSTAPHMGAVAPCPAGPGTKFLGTAFSIGVGTPSAPAFTAPSGFSITIQNCLNDASPPGTCSATGTSTDPANNPELSVTGNVFPPQEGTG